MRDIKKSILKIDINLKELYDDDTSVSGDVSSRTLSSASIRSDTQTQSAADTSRRVTRLHWRKTSDTVAQRPASANIAKQNTQTTSLRRRSSASLIAIFRERKLRLDAEWEKRLFEDKECPGIETGLPNIRHQSNEGSRLANLAVTRHMGGLSSFDEKTGRCCRKTKRMQSQMKATPRRPCQVNKINLNKTTELDERILVIGAAAGLNHQVAASSLLHAHGGEVSIGGVNGENSWSVCCRTNNNIYGSCDNETRFTRCENDDSTGDFRFNKALLTEVTLSARDVTMSTASGNVTVSPWPPGKKKSTRRKLKSAVEVSFEDDGRAQSSYEKLLRYLTLVRQYPDEFEKLRRPTTTLSTTPAHDRSLVRIAHAFNRHHREFRTRETPVQTAAYELGCRMKHGTWAVVPSDDMSLSQQSANNALERSNYFDIDLSGHVRFPDMDQTVSQHGAIIAELWRARRDAQRAMTSVSTQRSLQERETALKALGEEEGSLHQWWVSQKGCRYLRSGQTIKHTADTMSANTGCLLVTPSKLA